MSFDSVREILEEWSDQVRGTRGKEIADITVRAIESLSDGFRLPETFKKYISEYREREGALHSLVNYRDHFIHPFHVFCLGFVILDRWNDEKWTGLLDLMRRGEAGQDMKDESAILKKWFVTSIYHDVGYPSEKLEALIKEIFAGGIGREIKSQSDWGSILLANENLENIDRLSKLFATKSRSEKEAKVFKKWFCKQLIEIHDHGVLTALLLLDNDKINWKTEDMPMVEEAALAIALHNWKRNPKEPQEFDLGQLPVENFALAFLLSFCDDAQEWGRKTLLESAEDEGTQKKLLEPPAPDNKLDEISIGKLGTKVAIKYESRFDEPFRGTKTLNEVFSEIRAGFMNKWCLSRNETTRLMIEGRNKDGSSLGSFGAEFYGREAYEKKKRTKIEEKLLSDLCKDLSERIVTRIKESENLVEEISKGDKDFETAESELLKGFRIC